MSSKSIKALFAGVCLAAAPVSAQDDTAHVIAKLKQRDAEIKKYIDAAADTADAAFKEKLKIIINQDFDFQELSRRALGRYWKERTEPEQGEFVDVFGQIVRNSSVRKLDVYKADRIDYGEPSLRRSILTVPTVVFKKDASVEVEYKLHQVDGVWQVYDLVIDGVSTARDYRDAFYKEIRKNGYDVMLGKLKDRLAEEKEG